jgi:hypothetical protein
MRLRNSERSDSLALKWNGRISVEKPFVFFVVSVIASALFEKPSNPNGATAHVTAATPQNVRLVRESCSVCPGMQAPEKPGPWEFHARKDATGNQQYLIKLYELFVFADAIRQTGSAGFKL